LGRHPAGDHAKESRDRREATSRSRLTTLSPDAEQLEMISRI